MSPPYSRQSNSSYQIHPILLSHTRHLSKRFGDIALHIESKDMKLSQKKDPNSWLRLVHDANPWQQLTIRTTSCLGEKRWIRIHRFTCNAWPRTFWVCVHFLGCNCRWSKWLDCTGVTGAFGVSSSPALKEKIQAPPRFEFIDPPRQQNTIKIGNSPTRPSHRHGVFPTTLTSSWNLRFRGDGLHAQFSLEDCDVPLDVMM